MNIAIIHKLSNYTGFGHMDHGYYYTGSWIMSEDKSEEIVGGRLSLHATGSDQSFVSGMVIETIPIDNGRYFIIFKVDEEVISPKHTEGGRNPIKYYD